MLKTVFALAPRLSLHVAGAGILAMVSLMFAEIVSTKLFNYSLPYVIEYSEYLVPIIVFWGAAYTLAEKGHVRPISWFTTFRECAPLDPAAGYVLGLIFLIVVFWQLLQVALRSIEMKRYSFYPTPSPIGPPQLFACIGLGLFIFQLLVEIARMGLEIAGRRDPGPEQ
ncbi:MAG: TRAP transporter small permease [Rhodobacter sp.]|nr:TRAP transporter small permease [Rhodobacter sp.]